MQENTTKLKKKRGFFEAFSDSESDAIKARKLMHDLLRKQSGYQIYLQTSDSLLAIHQDKSIKIYDRTWDILNGQHINEWALENDEITKITLSTYPSDLASAIGKFTLAGGLMGGVAGLAVGAAIDAIKGPKTEDIWVWFEFHTEDSYPYACRYEAYARKEVPMVDRNIEEIFRDLHPLINKMKKAFSNKVKIMETPSQEYDKQSSNKAVGINKNIDPNVIGVCRMTGCSNKIESDEALCSGCLKKMHGLCD